MHEASRLVEVIAPAAPTRRAVGRSLSRHEEVLVVFEFWSRGSRTAERETEEMATCKGVKPEPATPDTEVEFGAVEEAIRIIQKHVDKEARNRWVEHLEVRDLCPRQKADLVADLARMFQ
jgi:hypothetical protein